jgi:hypothetical protein
VFSRIVVSLLLGFVLGTTGLVLLPDLGRLAGPLLCAGTLEPEARGSGLRFRCVQAEDGAIVPMATERVVLYTVPILACLLLLPASAMVARVERKASTAQGEMRHDLQAAVTARAEVLRITRSANLKRQILMRAAELRLVLWVQPPNGRPYEAVVAWLVEEESVRLLSVGAVLPVRVNPERPQRVYPAQPWAHFNWWS